MRARLLGIVLSLVVVVLVGLGVPLALMVASTQQQKLFLDRLTDTGLFASLAQRALTENRPELIVLSLRRYQDVYGVQVAVLDNEGTVFAASGTPIAVKDPQVNDPVVAALAGRPPVNGALLLPWDTHPLVLAEPVLVDGEISGVAVTVSATNRTRDYVLTWWIVLAAATVLVLGLAVFAALPVVRWVLRPVRRLDEATARLSSAVVSGRAVEPVGGESGPPELRRLSRSFDQMTASVTDVLAAQRAFVADASHQLRNPLTALRLRLGNLDDHVVDGAEEHLRAAEAEADRLTRILDELLTMARAEAGSVDPVEVDVDKVVKSRIAAWQVVASAKGAAMVLAGERGGLALAPPRGLEAILDALLDNALKFTPAPVDAEDVPLVEVEVRRGEQVTVAVRDHGPGMPLEDLERATDRFWRSKTQQNVTGSGLGLAIVRRIVERVGGELRLDLPGGGGLRVTVTFPVA